MSGSDNDKNAKHFNNYRNHNHNHIHVDAHATQLQLPYSYLTAVFLPSNATRILLHAFACSASSAAENGENDFDPDETRTRNLLIRSQTPYPLGHEATTTPPHSS